MYTGPQKQAFFSVRAFSDLVHVATQGPSPGTAHGGNGRGGGLIHVRGRREQLISAEGWAFIDSKLIATVRCLANFGIGRLDQRAMLPSVSPSSSVSSEHPRDTTICISVHLPAYWFRVIVSDVSATFRNTAANALGKTGLIPLFRFRS